MVMLTLGLKITAIPNVGQATISGVRVLVSRNGPQQRNVICVHTRQGRSIESSFI